MLEDFLSISDYDLSGDQLVMPSNSDNLESVSACGAGLF